MGGCEERDKWRSVKQNWEKNQAPKKKETYLCLGGKYLDQLPALSQIPCGFQEKARGVALIWEEKNSSNEKSWRRNAGVSKMKFNVQMMLRERIEKKRAGGVLGDLLFPLINYARNLSNINPEEALGANPNIKIHGVDGVRKDVGETRKNNGKSTFQKDLRKWMCIGMKQKKR